MFLNDNPTALVKFKQAEHLTKADQAFKENFRLNNEVMEIIQAKK